VQPSAVAVIAWLFSTYYIILQERRGCLEAIDAMTEYPRRTRAAREPYATNTNSCKKRLSGATTHPRADTSRVTRRSRRGGLGHVQKKICGLAARGEYPSQMVVQSRGV
jgi:hypothetical protein